METIIMDTKDDNLDRLLLNADREPTPGASGRLAQTWAFAFAREQRRERVRRAAIVASMAAACVAGVLIVMASKHASSDAPVPPIAHDVPAINPAPAPAGLPTSRPPTPMELAMLEAAERERAKRPSPEASREIAPEPVAARPAPMDAGALLRSAARVGVRERRAAVATLAADDSPAVAAQLATLLAEPDVRRDAARALLSRTDPVSRSIAFDASRWPASKALVRSVEAELSAQTPPESPAVPQNVLPLLRVVLLNGTEWIPSSITQGEGELQNDPALLLPVRIA
jgi:hypothetical protein